MLTRAARRRTRYDALQRLQSPTDSLILPWLCPAFIRWNSTRPLPPSPSASLRSKSPRRITRRSDTRHLATQIDDTQRIFAARDAIPFVGGPRLDNDAPLASMLRPWDAANPLTISEPSSTHVRIVSYKGVGGDSEEILQNLHASLRVGRLDRAANLIRRMRVAMGPDDLALVTACNEYLKELVDRLRSGSDVTYQSVQQWFEMDIKAQGITPNAQTFILMVKAVMLSLTGSKQERTLRRYLALAQEVGNDVWAQVISSGEFTGIEWSNLIRLQPRHLHPLPYEAEEVLAEEEEEDDHLVLAEQTETIHALETETDTLSLPLPRAVGQKGLGLATLKETLGVFRPESAIPYPHELDGTNEEKSHAWQVKRQLRLEDDVYNAALVRWRAETAKMAKIGINTAMNSNTVESLMWKWHGALVPALKKELREIRVLLDNWDDKPLKDPRGEFGPFLEQFTAEKLATITIIALLNTFVGEGLAQGIKVSLAAFQIGHHLEKEAVEVFRRMNEKQRRKDRMSADRLSMIDKLYRGDAPIQDTKLGDLLQSTKLAVQAQSKLEWPRVHKIRIGVLLLKKLIDTAKIDVTRTDPTTNEPVHFMQPALAHTYVFRQGKKIGMIQAHQALVEKLSKEPVKGVIGARLPMITLPRPWTGVMEGGYLRTATSVIRQNEKDDMQRMYAHAAAEKGDLDQLFAGLNVLGKTAWKVNRDVLHVMLQAWNSGEAIASIAPEKPEFIFPEKPGLEAGGREYARWYREVKRLENEKGGLHSERCFQNFQVEIGCSFADETFYFPHNVDFRGRAYPIPPYLNHLGADMARGMLKFANGKELGEVGLRWLKIHLANVYGYDKASLSDREKFAMDHFDDITDSVERPLDGKRWWLKAEDPWQCLACCMELKGALESDDPTKFVSYLPVHQDGTCNGLQHYAALGGDKIGASQVNLEPSDRPADIYTAVAELVKAEIRREAEENHPLAKQLEGKITRKVVKQTVMTNVYGVTFVGARAQVEKQLKELLDDQKDMIQLSSHIAQLIFKALSTMFSGATDIQKWLGDSARRICTSVTPEQIERARDFLDKGAASKTAPRIRKPKGEPKSGKQLNLSYILQYRNTVVWTTPLKLPVAQPYRIHKASEVYTALQQVRIKNPRSSDPVHLRKQLQAFPPNFIHSLDATHMLLSALKCDEVGLTFASVHDSFWTHASDVPKLNTLLRDAFIRMHSEDIIGRLAEEFKVRYRGCLYLKSIPVSSPAGQAVKKFRSSKKWRGWEGGIEELFLEDERQKLLQSEDPEQRRKGEEMETSASIVESMMNLGAISGSQEMNLPTLGEIPESPAKRSKQDKASAVAGTKGKGRKNKKDEAKGEAAATVEAPSDTYTFSDAVSPIEQEDLVNTPRLNPIKDIKEDPTDPISAAIRSEIEPKSTSKASTMLNVWLPLTFAELPQKGTFDVTRLRDSQYFFS